MNKIQQIKLMYNALAEYYQTNLSPEMLKMYAEDLENMELEDIGRAIKLVRNDPQQIFLPRPAVLREAILGKTEDQAILAANRILEAMRRIGRYNAERARNHIGALGWQVVECNGGWWSLCQSIESDDQVPTLRAQWIKLAASLIRSGRTPQIGSASLSGLTNTSTLLSNLWLRKIDSLASENAIKCHEPNEDNASG